MIRMFNAQGANGQSAPYRVINEGSSEGHPRPRVDFSLYADGTFGGGTVKLQASPDGGTTWFDVPSASLTVKGVVGGTVYGQRLRLDLSGATAPTLSAWLGTSARIEP